jgi:hypothetical protein
MSLFLLSDLDGLGDPEPLLDAVRLLRRHHHALTLVVPDARTFVAPPAAGLRRDLYTVLGRQEARRLAEARSLLGPLGVTVLAARRSDPPGLLLATPHARRRAA